jgi:formimidoylglutamate deiminase
MQPCRLRPAGRRPRQVQALRGFAIVAIRALVNSVRVMRPLGGSHFALMNQAMPERKLCFSSALLPSGWHDDVVVDLDEAGFIVEIETAERPRDGARLKGIAVPGIANVHSHAHQRAMVGWPSAQVRVADSFWTWREAMYGFALVMRPGRPRGRRSPALCRGPEKRLHGVGEFQYLHHQPDGTPMMTRPRCRCAVSLPPNAPASPSPCCRRSMPMAASAASRRPTPSAGLSPRRGFPRDRGEPGRDDRQEPSAPARHIAAFAAGRHQGPAAGGDRRRRAAAPIHIHVAEQEREVEDCIAWCGRRPVEISARQLRCLAALVRHPRHPYERRRPRALARSGAVAGLCPTTEANLGDGIFPCQVPRGRRRHRHRIRQPYDREPGRRPAPARIFPAPAHRARNVLAGGPHRSTGRRLLDAVSQGGASALSQPMGAIEPRGSVATSWCWTPTIRH